MFLGITGELFKTYTAVENDLKEEQTEGSNVSGDDSRMDKEIDNENDDEEEEYGGGGEEEKDDDDDERINNTGNGEEIVLFSNETKKKTKIKEEIEQFFKFSLFPKLKN